MATTSGKASTLSSLAHKATVKTSGSAAPRTIAANAVAWSKRARPGLWLPIEIPCIEFGRCAGPSIDAAGANP